MWTAIRDRNYGVAIYNYAGDTCYGLPLELGECVHILEECDGWYRGYSVRNKGHKGIFPSSHIALKSNPDGSSLFGDQTLQEIVSVLKEWFSLWKDYYVIRDNNKFNSLRKFMLELLDSRKKLLTGTLTQDQIRELKLNVAARIDFGNRILDLDLVPRVQSEAADADSMSVVELYQVHVDSAASSQAASARGTVKKRSAKKSLSHHIYFCLRDFVCSMSEDAELYFSLYDSQSSSFISERFLVKIAKNGQSQFMDKLVNNNTLFTDLGGLDLNRDLHLVCQIVRYGRMLSSDQHKKYSGHMFRRPYACGVQSLDQIRTDSTSEEYEFTMKLYQCEEKDFYQLHELIIRKQNNKFTSLSGQGNYGILVSLRMFHGEPSSLKQDNPILFKNLPLTKKLGFSDVIMPGDVRNDLYIILDRGDFEKGGKSIGKNIEVLVQVLDEDGEVIEDCIWGAAGSDGRSQYHSTILYHNNAPKWCEVVKIAVPTEKFNGSHIRFEYSHCSTRDRTDKKLFGFSFAPLMDNEGATLQDGCHELYVYKCEDKNKIKDVHLYTALPWGYKCGTDSPNSNYSMTGYFSRSNKEIVLITTLLCSTKLTQNADLLSLLKWRHNKDGITETLGKVMSLDGQEIVKFLQDILDALFNMFSTEDGNSTDQSGLVFQVLVSIFSQLETTKFEHFKPVMDTYLTEHFAAALVYKGLIACLKHSAEVAITWESQEHIQKTFRALEYISKFVIQSRLLFARATGGQNEDIFKLDLINLFKSFNDVLKMPTFGANLLETQIALLGSISSVYEQLVQVLPVNTCAQLAALTFNSLPEEPSTLLVQANLKSMLQIVRGELFRNPDSRSTLLLTISVHLRTRLGSREEVKLCSEILGEILTYLHKESKGTGIILNYHQGDVEILATNLLDMIIQLLLVIESKMTGRIVACLIGLLKLMGANHYKRLWEEFGDRKPLKDFFFRAFLVFRDLVKQEVFPNDWIVMRMVSNSVMLSALQACAHALAEYFLDGSWFDSHLWSNYLNLAVAFLTQPSLQLETFSDVKREKILQSYGDMRVSMGFQILNVWSNLGRHKINFIPSMVGPFLEVTLVPEPELRRATLPIFFDMMETEQKHRGNFKQVETEMIDKLDILVSENKGDDEYRRLFNTMLLEKVQGSDPVWQENGTAFINSVTRLLERLLDYRNVIQGDENRDKRMSCTVNLLNFYKTEINRKEMYIRYVYKLHDLHESAENFIEAGFTLKLHADLLEWSSRSLHSDHIYPGQQEWQRKEQIYLKIINYFDKGKLWEMGIPLCKELLDLYENRLYDYPKCSKILETLSQFFRNIFTQLRPEPEYFRVGFYGMSFPLFVRNKVFIYRGLEYERIGAFTQRLQLEFPSAQIMTKMTTPDDSVLISDGQYIQICNVKPIPKTKPEFDSLDVPEKIRAYYLVNDVTRFQYDRAFHKGTPDRDNEFKTMWIERTILEINTPLPGILRWFEVTQRQVEQISPLQFACEIMTNKNQELRRLSSEYSTEQHSNVNHLSMMLQGIIDANVNGGISKYQEAFFNSDLVQSIPNAGVHLGALKNAIREQMMVLETGLNVHGKLAPSGVQPLHRRLVERFSQIKRALKESSLSIGSGDSGEYRKSSSIINTPLPPLPIERKLTSDVISNRSSGSSGGSVYGQLIMETDSLNLDDDIYSQPGDSSSEKSRTVKPLPCREYRARSLAYTNGALDSRGSSPRSSTRDSAPNVWETWSWTENSVPPLPPRSQGYEKRHSTGYISIVTPQQSGENPPALPRKPCKKVITIPITDNIPSPPPLPPKSLPCQVPSPSSSPSSFVLTNGNQILRQNYCIPRLSRNSEEQSSS